MDEKSGSINDIVERLHEFNKNSLHIISDDGEVEITDISLGEKGEMVIKVKVVPCLKRVTKQDACPK